MAEDRMLTDAKKEVYKLISEDNWRLDKPQHMTEEYVKLAMTAAYVRGMRQGFSRAAEMTLKELNNLNKEEA